jgi:hypothetical protein
VLIYSYAADLLCEDCGRKCREELTAAGKAPEDPYDESSYDSDDFPKGPTEEGESDAPSYCAHCDTFLESRLTNAGAAYVNEVILDHFTVKRRPCVEEWIEHYQWDSRINTDPLD